MMRNFVIFILSNILIDANNSNLIITATDLDLIFINEISNVEISEEGKTTTTSSIMYDIIRKFSSGKKINFNLTTENKIQPPPRAQCRRPIWRVHVEPLLPE